MSAPVLAQLALDLADALPAAQDVALRAVIGATGAQQILDAVPPAIGELCASVRPDIGVPACCVVVRTAALALRGGASLAAGAQPASSELLHAICAAHKSACQTTSAEHGEDVDHVATAKSDVGDMVEGDLSLHVRRLGDATAEVAEAARGGLARSIACWAIASLARAVRAAAPTDLAADNDAERTGLPESALPPLAAAHLLAQMLHAAPGSTAAWLAEPFASGVLGCQDTELRYYAAQRLLPRVIEDDRGDALGEVLLRKYCAGDTPEVVVALAFPHVTAWLQHRPDAAQQVATVNDGALIRLLPEALTSADIVCRRRASMILRALGQSLERTGKSSFGYIGLSSASLSVFFDIFSALEEPQPHIALAALDNFRFLAEDRGREESLSPVPHGEWAGRLLLRGAVHPAPSVRRVAATKLADAHAPHTLIAQVCVTAARDARTFTDSLDTSSGENAAASGLVRAVEEAAPSRALADELAVAAHSKHHTSLGSLALLRATEVAARRAGLSDRAWEKIAETTALIGLHFDAAVSDAISAAAARAAAAAVAFHEGTNVPVHHAARVLSAARAFPHAYAALRAEASGPEWVRALHDGSALLLEKSAGDCSTFGTLRDSATHLATLSLLAESAESTEAVTGALQGLADEFNSSGERWCASVSYWTALRRETALASCGLARDALDEDVSAISQYHVDTPRAIVAQAEESRAPSAHGVESDEGSTGKTSLFRCVKNVIKPHAIISRLDSALDALDHAAHAADADMRGTLADVCACASVAGWFNELAPALARARSRVAAALRSRQHGAETRARIACGLSLLVTYGATGADDTIEERSEIATALVGILTSDPALLDGARLAWRAIADLIERGVDRATAATTLQRAEDFLGVCGTRDAASALSCAAAALHVVFANASAEEGVDLLQRFARAAVGAAAELSEACLLDGRAAAAVWSCAAPAPALRASASTDVHRTVAQNIERLLRVFVRSTRGTAVGAVHLARAVRAVDSPAVDALAGPLAALCLAAPLANTALPARRAGLDPSYYAHRADAGLRDDLHALDHVHSHARVTTLQWLTSQDNDPSAVELTSAVARVLAKNALELRGSASNVIDENARRAYRVWQALGVLVPHVSAETRNQIADVALRALRVKNAAARLKQFVEIALMGISLLDEHTFTEHIVARLARDDTPAIESTSLVCIVLNVMHYADRDVFDRLAERVLSISVPLTMHHHNSLRTAAQIMLRPVLPRAIEHARARGGSDPTVLQRLHDALESERGFASVRDARQFLHCRHPLELCSVEGLFDVVPRTAGAEFDHIDFVPQPILVRLRSVLRESKSGANAEDANDKGVVDSTAELADAIATLQQKITPWEALLRVDVESALTRQEASLHQRQDIIVVASLVRKGANLGGLARTCEIFRASELCLADVSIMQDGVFKGTSVGAEQWQPIRILPPDQVAAFAQEKRREGYSIVALEQASNSVTISRYSFPSRCVLVLGEEKSGIPPDVFSLVDQCVEIPQLGVLRSLNVHVSASIMLWEYVRQRVFALRNTALAEQ